MSSLSGQSIVKQFTCTVNTLRRLSSTLSSGQNSQAMPANGHPNGTFDHRAPKEDEDDEDVEDPHDSPVLNAADHAANRRRGQGKTFEEWIRTELPGLRKTSTGSVNQHASSRGAYASNGDLDQTRSIQSLINESENKRIISHPREYQLELFERAKTENLIAVLDTGMGKTLIAILLLRWVIDEELERRASYKSPKVSFFLGTSVNLVMQQYAVIEANLPHPVRLLYGAMNIDAWSKEMWQETLSENKIIVCTAEILNQALARAYVTVKQINLLIFDEAHHAKKDHPYARIIKDYYLHESDLSERPRIFGMTASPIDAKTDVSRATRTLEVLLHSRIITTGELSSLQSSNRPKEEVRRYKPHHRPYNSELINSLTSRFGHLLHIAALIAKAHTIAQHLGDWFADQYLLGLVGLHKKQKIESAVRKAFQSQDTPQGRENMQALLEQYKEVYSYLDEWQSQKAQAINNDNISDKIRCLAYDLREQYTRSARHRCLVFVEEKTTAYLLSRCFQQMNLLGLRCDYLVGAGEAFADDARSTVREQAITLLKFRRGDLNCIFATSVAEEGLDVPECNLVIRFDIYKTMIQYIQSRGRARQAESRFIHMLEDGNSVHEQMSKDVRRQEVAMRRFCEGLPADRRLLNEEDDDPEDEDKSKRFFIEPETGAKLTERNASVFLANFVAAIPADFDEPQHPFYHVINVGSRFKSEIVFPSGSPITSIVSKPCAKKTLAKRAAAFDACMELRKAGYLDSRFRPTYAKKVRVKQNYILAQGLNKQDRYPMRTKPSIWRESRGILPTQLFLTLIDFANDLDRPLTSMILLTRTRMPEIPHIPLFPDGDKPTLCVCKPQQEAVSFSADQVQKLGKFTLRIFRDLFSKHYENASGDLSYFLAPVCRMPDPRTSATSCQLDWDAIDTASAVEVKKWATDDPSNDLVNKILIDPFIGSRKFLVSSVNESLRPQDSLPADSIPTKFKDTILDSSNSMRPPYRDMSAFSSQQPVLNAQLLDLRRNLLVPSSEQDVKAKRTAYICPEPLELSVLPSSFAVSCLLWPSIIWRLESVLITQEACGMLGLSLDPKLSLAAFTKDSDESMSYGTVELVNFRQGMGENYERLEFLGDTFLKMATTISTYTQNMEESEESLHTKRMFMLCNRNLFNVATELGLHKFVRTMAFNRRLWYPEGLNLVRGKGSKVNAPDVFENQTHELSDKTIADVSEALIGAAYLTYHDTDKWKPELWSTAIRAVSLFVKSEDHKMLEWADYNNAYDMPRYYTRKPTASERDMVDRVRLMHDYNFQSPTILRSAFLHPCQPRELEQLPSYQGLEFLGDALLDMAIVSHIFYRFPTRDPQWLTETKTAMVANRFLGALACTLGFHKLLRHNSAILQAQITSYVTELEEVKASAGDARDYWTKVSDPPKCLADIVESYVGAMFIDSGFNYAEVQRFFDEHIKWFFEDMSVYANYTHGNPITSMFHMVQETYHCQGTNLLTREIPVVQRTDRKELVVGIMIHNHVVGHSTGTSSKYAGVRAAKDVISVLEGVAVDEFRDRYSCDCRGEKDASKTMPQSSDIIAV